MSTIFHIQIIRFICVGLIATATYFLLARFFVYDCNFAAHYASLAAFIIASIFSYFGHRCFTFKSTQKHDQLAPRFILLTVLNYGVAFIIPYILSEHLKQPLITSLLTTSLVIPCMSYVLMNKIVFKSTITCANNR